ncbi:MAG: Ig-like domain-containing protein [Geminicoccaceae bacterium]
MKLKFEAALVPALLATTALYPASRAWALEVPSGGTVSAINRSGQHYRIHTFTPANDGTGAFNIPTSWPGGTLTADYLIVGGGGSGVGSWYGEGGSLYQYTGAGGGGGGMIETLSQSIGAAAYDVTVGAGGTNPNNMRLYGEKGGNSAFNGETALGGGTPAFTTSVDTRRDGGSGGGGGIVQRTSQFTTYPPGTGTAGQGYQGGSSASAPPNDGIAGGGGGGAGGAGGDASPYVGGNGGNGRQSAITGLFYGGGGGGVYSGGFGSASAGAGGTGGGGAGSPTTIQAENGADGRGGGGGGAFSTYFAGDGGDGTVVIAYYLPPPEVTLSSPATSPVNQFTVTAEFTLAPNPSSFTTGDITITNGTASNLQLVSTGTGNNAGAIYSFDVTSTSDGAIDVQIASASFTDTVGVASTTPSNQLAYTADTTAPAAPTGPVIADADDSAAKGDFITSVEQPDISGTAEANSTVEILVGGIKVGETTADGSGNWTYSFGAGELSEGDNSVTMTAKDAAGNVSPASPAQNITVDTIAPQLLAITIDPTSVKYGETADIAFTFNEAVAGFSKDDVTLDTGSIGAVTVDPGDPKIYHATFTPAVDFEGTVNVTVAASVYRHRRQRQRRRQRIERTGGHAGSRGDDHRPDHAGARTLHRHDHLQSGRHRLRRQRHRHRLRHGDARSGQFQRRFGHRIQNRAGSGDRQDRDGGCSRQCRVRQFGERQSCGPDLLDPGRITGQRVRPLPPGDPRRGAGRGTAVAAEHDERPSPADPAGPRPLHAGNPRGGGRAGERRSTRAGARHSRRAASSKRGNPTASRASSNMRTVP